MPSRIAPSSLRRRTLLQLFCSTGLLLAGCGGGSEATSNDGSDALLKTVADGATASGLVGVAVGEVTAQTASAVVAGRRRQGESAPVQSNDRFAIGSNTKALTAAAIAALAERGDLSTELTLSQVFAEWADDIHPAYSGVTIRDLLHHRGALPAFNGQGLEEEAFLADLAADTRALPVTLTGRRAYFARWLLTRPPVAGVTAGRDFHYSNAGYALAAAAIETRSGRTFESVFEEVLVRPLALQGHWRSPVPGPQDSLWGHEGPAGALTVVEATDESLATKDWLDVLAPGGHWACSAAAYAQWMRWHVRALRGESTPLPTVYVKELRAASDNAYVWGWQSLTTPSRVLLTHTGYVNGFMAEAIVDTRGDRALFGLSNTGHMADDGTSWVLNAIDTALAKVLEQRSVAE